jgi:hypothetical protein
MRLKKLCVERKELRMKNLFDAGHINFGVFDPGMVPVDEQSGKCEE